MSSDKLEAFPIRFTGKNYSAWEFQFKLFVKGKELWGHIDGSVFGSNDIYKFITLLPKDYCLIPGKCTKNLFAIFCGGPKYLYKFMMLLPKDYDLIPNNNAMKLVCCVPFLLY